MKPMINVIQSWKDIIFNPKAIKKYGEYYIKFEQKILSKIEKRLFEYKFGSPTDIMAEDWDNLILLDACRYDIFKNVSGLEGRLESRISAGSMSKEFIEKMFTGRKLHDTIYITANPFFTDIDDDVFHTIISTFDEWDEERQTVMPQSMVDAVITANKQYPNKRIIAHFMQPHQPYIGDKAYKIRSEIEKKSENWGFNNPVEENKEDKISMFDAARHGDMNVSKEDIREAYCESLEITLENVVDLTEKIDGKTILSADHGELLGERVHLFARYGHPAELWRRELRIVPWFIINSAERRDTKTDPPEQYDTAKKEDIDERLRALGYK